MPCTKKLSTFFKLGSIYTSDFDNIQVSWFWRNTVMRLWVASFAWLKVVTKNRNFNGNWTCKCSLSSKSTLKLNKNFTQTTSTLGTARHTFRNENIWVTNQIDTNTIIAFYLWNYNLMVFGGWVWLCLSGHGYQEPISYTIYACKLQSKLTRWLSQQARAAPACQRSPKWRSCLFCNGRNPGA